MGCTTEPEDCAGVAGGTAELDNCNVCDSDATNDGVELWRVCYSINTTTALDLFNTGLTGEIPSEIEDLTNLNYLVLESNQLIGIIPPEIGSLTNLQLLYLNNNQLIGEIPPEIGFLTNLNYLVLWGNQLTGSIPSEIFNITNLQGLNLGINQLTGQIPPEIGQLTNLTNLYLDNNQLTGEIPVEICNQGDSSPNLSNNKLCPPYPSCLSETDIGTQDTSECEYCEDNTDDPLCDDQ